MRSVHRFALVACVTMVTVGVALGQGGFGGFFGGRGQGDDPAALLRRDDVKKELKLTDEQSKKVPDAVWKALGDVLEPAQAKRLRQLSLQLRGVQAFTDAHVQKELNLTAEQKEGIKTALEDMTKEIKEAFSEGAGGFAKIGDIRKGTMEKVTGMLKGDQKTTWTAMVGEEFKFEQKKGFGKGFGKGKGKGKKKTDD